MTPSSPFVVALVTALLVVAVMLALDGCRDDPGERAREVAAADDALVRALDQLGGRIEALESRQPAEAAARAAAAEATARAVAPVATLAGEVRQLAGEIRQRPAVTGGVPVEGTRDAAAPPSRPPSAAGPRDCDALADACTALADSAAVALAAYAAQVEAQDAELATCAQLSAALRAERDLYRERAERLRPVVDAAARSGPRLYVGLGQTHIPTQSIVPPGPLAAPVTVPRYRDLAITVAAPARLRLPLVGSVPLAGVVTASRSCQSASLTLGL